MQKTNEAIFEHDLQQAERYAAELPSLEFGLKSVEHLPFDRLNVFTQTRKAFYEEDLEELVRSIESLDEAGRPRNELLHPPFVNILDRASAEKYLIELNACHKTDHRLDEAVPLHDGRYAIVVAGHRRRLAIGRIIARQHADPTTSTVASNVAYNLEFAEALRIQIEENTHLQLPVYEIARAIQATYRYGVERGDFTSVADCVKALPFGEEKVRSALRFCEMSEFVQNTVEDGRIGYGVAVALYPAMLRLRQKYADLPPEEAEEVVQHSIQTWVLRAIENEWSRTIVARQVAEMIESMKKEAAFDMKLFEFDDVAAARQQRQQAYRELFTGGLSRMRAFVGLAAQAELFKSLPLEHQEAILEELDEFRMKLGSIAIRAEEPQLFA